MSQGKDSFKNKVAEVWAFIKKVAARVWRYLKVAKMEWILMIGLFVLDLVSKAIVNATTSVHQTVTLIPKFLNIHNIHNYDAAFGSTWISDALGSVGSRILFCVFAVAATIVFVIILVRSKGGSKLFRVSLAMLAAGAMGNCIDRMFLAYVRDFIEFVYFGLTIAGEESFYVFNIADAELVIGVVLIIIYFIFLYKDKDKSVEVADRSAVAAQDAAGAQPDGPAASSDDENSVSADEAATEKAGGDPDAVADLDVAQPDGPVSEQERSEQERDETEILTEDVSASVEPAPVSGDAPQIDGESR